MDKLIRKRIHKLKINNSKKDQNSEEDFSNEFKDNNLFAVTDLIKNELGINNNSNIKNNSVKNLSNNYDDNIEKNIDLNLSIDESLLADNKLVTINTSIVDEYVNIVLSGDQNVSLALSVLIKSIILNSKNYKKLKFFIICDNPYHLDFHLNFICKNLVIKDNINDRLNLDKNTIINYIMPSEDLLEEINEKKSFHSKEKELKPTSDFNFIRFYFNKLIPDYINKCIYLDNDMIVKGDIEELFDSLTPEYSIGVVYPEIPYKLEIDDWILDKNLKNSVQRDNLFNAGMYVFYLKSWNYLNYTEKCLNLAFENRENKLYDGGTQPVMNIVCKLVKEIDKSWNQTGLSEGQYFNKDLTKCVHNANIIHFTGFYKPWLKLSQEYTQNIFLEEWYIYLVDINPRFLKFEKFVYEKLTDIIQEKTSNFYRLYNNFKEKLKYHMVKSDGHFQSNTDYDDILNITKNIEDNKLVIKIIFSELKNMDEVSAFLTVNLNEEYNKLHLITSNDASESYDIDLDVGIDKETLKAKFNKKRRTVTISSIIINDSVIKKYSSKEKLNELLHQSI